MNDLKKKSEGYLTMYFHSFPGNEYFRFILKVILFLIPLLHFPSQNVKSSQEYKSYSQNGQAQLLEASSALNHANTYYWYGRYKTNLLSEFLTAKNYLDTFNITVRQLSPDSSEMVEVETLKHKAASLEMALRTIIPISAEKVNGRIPLYLELMFRNPDFEGIGKIEESIVNNTLSTLIEMPYPYQPLGNTMFYDVLLLRGPDTLMYEAVQEYIASHTNHYLISLHELSEILGRNNPQNMYDGSFVNEDLVKVAGYFNTQKLGLLKIRSNDIVNGLYYYGAEFSTWSSATSKVGDVLYAEGFSNDKDWVEVEMYSLTILLFMMIVLVIMLLTIFWYKKTDHHNNNLKRAFLAGVYGSFSLFAGFVVIFIASFFISKIAPDADSFYIEPQVRYGWQVLLGVVLILVPVIINYLFLIRFFSESLHRPVNLFAFFAGSLSAAPLLLFYQCYYKYETISSTGRYLILFPLFLILSFVLAHLYKDIYNMTPVRKKKETTAMIFLLLAAICALIIIIQEPGNPDYLYIVSGLALLITGFSLPWINIKKTFQEKPAAQEARMPITDVPSLRKYFSQPENYIAPSLKESNRNESPAEVFKTIIEKLFNSGNEQCFTVATLAAPSGTGKTRFLNELRKQKDLPEYKGEIHFFYGDCDEITVENAMPYEPFVQALGEELGVNRFMNPQMINSAISEKMEQVHFEALSAFASLIGGKKNGVQKGASEPELAGEIISFLKKYAAKNKVTLIIEDLQWMDKDKDTIALFDSLIKQLIIYKGPFLKNLCILVTIRSDIPDFFSEKNQNKNPIVKRLFDFIVNNKGIIRHLNIGDIINLTPEDYFKKQAQFLRIDFQTTQKIQRLLEEDSSPMYINELMVNLADRKWLLRENDTFTLSDDSRLDEMPPPGYVNNLLSDQLSRLDQQIMQLLEIAAFIGLRFYTRIVAFVRYGPDTFEQRLLEVYYKLQEAEKLGIIRDDTTENDAYEFTSKQLVSAIKDKYRRNRNEKDTSPAYLYQVVREYNKRIFEAYIFFFKEQADTNPELIRQLALLSRSFDPKENSGKIIMYNEKAGDQFSETGNLQKAVEYYEYLLDQIVSKTSDSERYRILNKLFALYLDIGLVTQKKLIKTFEKDQSQNLPPAIILKYVLALQRTTTEIETDKNFVRINVILDGLKNSLLSQHEEMRRKFYKIHSIMLIVGNFSYSDKNFVEWKDGLTKLIAELEDASDRDNEMNQLYGEILNTLALSYARARYPLSTSDFTIGINLLDRRLQLLLKEKDLRLYPNWDLRLEAMQCCLVKLKTDDPSLAQHDKVSMKFLYSFYAELFINAGEPTGTCLSLAEMAIEVNRTMYDYKGILLSIDPLTDLYQIVGKEKETQKLLEEGISIAETFKFPNLEGLERKFRIKMAQFPVERQIHCLRHFILPESSELSEFAVNLSITLTDLNNYFNISGSKFQKRFAKDPLSCFVRLREKLKYSKIEMDRQHILVANFSFPKDLYPDGIGFSNIISMEEINEDERKEIKQTERDGIKVNVLKTNKMFITWQAILVIDIKPVPTVLTLYPGDAAPPLPDTRHLAGEELEKSKAFWETHLFLESS